MRNFGKHPQRRKPKHMIELVVLLDRDATSSELLGGTSGDPTCVVRRCLLARVKDWLGTAPKELVRGMGSSPLKGVRRAKGNGCSRLRS